MEKTVLAFPRRIWISGELLEKIKYKDRITVRSNATYSLRSYKKPNSLRINKTNPNYSPCGINNTNQLVLNP